MPTLIRIPALLALCVALTAPRALAQVGHAPTSSPYHDIASGHSFAAVFGQFGGGGGRLGIGPQDGSVYGVRYDLRVSKPVQFGFSFAQGNLQRYVVDPFLSVATRKTGPVKTRVTFADLSLQLNLTGGKAWQRLAPYTGVSLGVAFGKHVPEDTSAYRFGNKFYFAPQIGTRLFLTSHLHLRADVRALFWKLTYPNQFTVEPAVDPGTADDPHALIPGGRLNEWTLSPWLQVGLGYSFKL